MKNIKENEHEGQMLYQIGLWVSKFLNDYDCDKFKYKIENVTNPEGKNIGSYELTVKKIK